ncbi:MAG: hypothetical protein R2800_15265 [Flavipsychrobacter sp.]
MSNVDFIGQFTNLTLKQRDSSVVAGLINATGLNTYVMGQVYCFDENANKVWLKYTNNTQVGLKMKDDQEKLLLLHTIKYYDDTIEGVEYNALWASKKVSYFNMHHVSTFTVYKKYNEEVVAYYDLDSVKRVLDSAISVVRLKNDSLEKIFTTGKEWVIKLCTKNKNRKDTFMIHEDACYHIKFKDGNKTLFGVVERISKDSIYITSSLNSNTSKHYKEDYKVYKYPISEIAELHLMRSGGYSFKKIDVEDCEMSVDYLDKASSNLFRAWYAVMTPEMLVYFYRAWLMDRGYMGISEQNNKPVMFEGGVTH